MVVQKELERFGRSVNTQQTYDFPHDCGEGGTQEGEYQHQVPAGCPGLENPGLNSFIQSTGIYLSMYLSHVELQSL